MVLWECHGQPLQRRFPGCLQGKRGPLPRGGLTRFYGEFEAVLSWPGSTEVHADGEGLPPTHDQLLTRELARVVGTAILLQFPVCLCQS